MKPFFVMEWVRFNDVTTKVTLTVQAAWAVRGVTTAQRRDTFVDDVTEEAWYFTRAWETRYLKMKMKAGQSLAETSVVGPHCGWAKVKIEMWVKECWADGLYTPPGVEDSPHLRFLQQHPSVHNTHLFRVARIRVFQTNPASSLRTTSLESRRYKYKCKIRTNPIRTLGVVQMARKEDMGSIQEYLKFALLERQVHQTTQPPRDILRLSRRSYLSESLIFIDQQWKM